MALPALGKRPMKHREILVLSCVLALVASAGGAEAGIVETVTATASEHLEGQCPTDGPCITVCSVDGTACVTAGTCSPTSTSSRDWPVCVVFMLEKGGVKVRILT